MIFGELRLQCPQWNVIFIMMVKMMMIGMIRSNGDDCDNDKDDDEEDDDDDDDDVAVSFQEGGIQQRPLASHPGAILACLKQWKQNNRNSFAQKLLHLALHCTALTCFALHASPHYWQLKVTTATWWDVLALWQK